MTEKMKKESFETLLKNLELVAKSLEGGTLSLEDSLKSYESGVGLVKEAQARLEAMEGKIEQLMADGSTQPLADQGA